MAAIDPARLSPEQLAKLLTKAGRRALSEGDVEQLIAEGLPTNDDGTLHLVHVAAWLIKATNGKR